MHLPATEEDNSPAKIFQDKIASRIRADIGELMPDDMLKQVVSDAIKGELYRKVAGSDYQTQEWITKEVRSLFGERIRELVHEEVENREAEMRTKIKDTIQDMIPGIFAEVIMAGLRGQMQSIEYTVTNAMNRNY